MEIPKAMLEEVNSVQNKLTNAILQHQVCVNNLEKDPNNSEDIHKKNQIQNYILSLGKSQKQIVERLRRAVKNESADNANESKVSIASLWGLNNNNHITNNNETKHETVANGFETKPSKEHYEEVVTNGDVPSPVQHNDCIKQSPSSAEENASGEDDIVEVPMDESRSKEQEEAKKKYRAQLMNQELFLYGLELITTRKALELQNKRAERKRRSTANPQFVYSSAEHPSKRQKKVAYLQSGNAPHTRQTTARMNGPSPPPPSKAQSTKSTSLQARANATKSLILVQKSSSSRPNILRNAADSKVYAKNKIEDKQTQSSATSAKTIQIGGKTVHLPGLPSSLTIERIENNSLVCITCRNKTSGPLTVCETCSRSYHVTCHTMPAPLNTCPKCAIVMGLKKNVQKEEETEGGERMDVEKPPRIKGDKLVAATLAPGATGKARENSEIYKTSSGLHKADASEKKRNLPSTFGTNQLPASTFLIPIASDNTSDAEQSEDGKLTSVANHEQRQDVVPRNPVVLSQSQRSGVTYVQAEEQSYSHQSDVSTQSEKHQSYLIVKKITESGRKSDQSAGGQADDQSQSAIVNYQLPTTSGCSSSLEAGIVVAHSLLFGRNNRKRKTARAIPPLHRIIGSEGLLPVTSEYQLDRTTLNGRKPWAKLSRGKLCINQQSAGSRPATETLFPSYNDSVEIGDDHLQITKPTLGSPAEETASFDNRAGKHRSARAGTIVHSLFPSNNRPYIVSDRAHEPRSFGTNDRDCPLLRQQLRGLEHEQLESREQSGGRSSVQLQRHALTRFFEHVKLEEAHIPAPPRTELVHKSKVTPEGSEELGIDDENVGRKGASDRRYDDGAVDGTDAALLTSSSNSDEDSLDEETRRDRGDASDIAVASRDSYEKNTADWSPLCRSSSVPPPSVAGDNEHARANSQSTALFFQSTPCEKKQRDDDGALRIAQSNLSELLNEVSVPDDKADTERQDLPSGGRPSSRSSISSSSGGGGGSSSNSSSDGGGGGGGGNSNSSSGHSDTPEQAMNDANSFASSHIAKEMRELLNDDNPTSPGDDGLVHYLLTMDGGDDDDVVNENDDDADAVTG